MALWAVRFLASSVSMDGRAVLRRRLRFRNQFVHSRDAERPASRFIDGNNHAAQAHIAFRDGKERGEIRDETIHDRIDRAAQDGIGRTAHSGITQKRGAARENLFVGGLHMRMRADDGGNFPIEEPAERDFLARRLGMRVDENDRRLCAHLLDCGLDRAKGIFQNRLHERAPLDDGHAHFSFRGFEDDQAVSRRARGIVHRAQQTRLRVNESEDVLLVPDMIARRDDGSSGAQQIDGNLRRDPAATRRVFPAMIDYLLERDVGDRLRL